MSAYFLLKLDELSFMFKLLCYSKMNANQTHSVSCLLCSVTLCGNSQQRAQLQVTSLLLIFCWHNISQLGCVCPGSRQEWVPFVGSQMLSLGKGLTVISNAHSPLLDAAVTHKNWFIEYVIIEE